jgi:hypothetical protein
MPRSPPQRLALVVTRQQALWDPGEAHLDVVRCTSRCDEVPRRPGDTSRLLSRISYCTADKMHDKVFAYIAQSQQNESLECHAFLCTKRKVVSVRTGPRGDRQ